MRIIRNKSEHGYTTLLISVLVAGASLLGVELMQDRAAKKAGYASGLAATDQAQQGAYSALLVMQSLFAAQNVNTWAPRSPQPSDSADKYLTIGGIDYQLWDKNTYTYPPISDAPIVYLDRYPADAQTSVGMVKTRDASGFGTIWSASAFSSATNADPNDLTVTVNTQFVPNKTAEFTKYFADPSKLISEPALGSTVFKAQKLNFRNDKVYLVVEAETSRTDKVSKSSRSQLTRAELSIFEPPTPTCKTSAVAPTRGYYKMSETPTGKISVTGVVREIIQAQYCVQTLQGVETCAPLSSSQFAGFKNDFVFAQNFDILGGNSLTGSKILPSQLENTVYFKAVVKGTNGALYDCDVENPVVVEPPVRTTTFFSGNGPGSCALDGLCNIGSITCDTYGLSTIPHGESKGFTGDVFQRDAVTNPSLLAQFRSRTTGDPSASIPNFIAFGNRNLCHSRRPAVTNSASLKEYIITDLKIVAGTNCPAGYEKSNALDPPSVRDNAACSTSTALVDWAAEDATPGNAERNDKPTATRNWVAPCQGANQYLTYNQIVGCYPGGYWFQRWHASFVTLRGAQCYKTWDSDVSKTSQLLTTADGITGTSYTLCKKLEPIASLRPSDTNKLVVYDVDMRGRTNNTTRSSDPAAMGCTTQYTAIDGGTLLDCISGQVCSGLANIVMCKGPITAP